MGHDLAGADVLIPLHFNRLGVNNVARPVGSKTRKPTLTLRQLVDAASAARVDPATKRDGLQRVVDLMFEKAMGVQVQENDAHAPGGVRVFTLPPDVAAAKLLIEHRFGRAKETVEVQTPDLAPNSLPWLILPQLPKKKA